MKLPSSGFALLFLSLALLLGGCENTPPPDASTTLPSGSGSGRADFVLPSEVYGAGASGLEFRDEAFSEVSSQREGLLAPIYFGFDKSDIPPAERGKLTDAANYLQDNPSHRLLIEGHCDWRGTSEYNLNLGDRRAGSVSNFLQQLGISPDRIETVSKGDLDAQPQAPESQMALDRRAELIVILP